MISFNSIKWFIIINSFIISFASIQYMMLYYFKYTIVNIFISNIVRLSITMNVLDNLSKNKKYITEGTRTRQFDSVDFIKTTSVETFSFYLLTHYFSNTHLSIFQDIMYFIPRSFIFELILDFGHYWTHRIAHSIPIVYKIVHKKHHSDYLINVNTSYNHTMYDYILTNTFPLLLAGYMIPSSIYFYNLIFWYKGFIEFSGHTGKNNNAGSFPQCKWLPQLLRIELYSKDHNIHHTNSEYNFSKRFSIWDKLFGTYREVPNLRTLFFKKCS